MSKKIWNFIAVFALALFLGMFLYNTMDYFDANSNPVRWVVLLIVAAWVSFQTKLTINEKEEDKVKNTLATNKVEYEVYSIETGNVLSRTESRRNAYDLFEKAKQIYQSKIGLRKVTTTKEIEILEEDK
jgi:hypothetical protein